MPEHLKESLWYMTVALENHYKGTKEESIANQIIALERRILHLTEPDNGGCYGLYEGWLDEIQESEHHLSC